MTISEYNINIDGIKTHYYKVDGNSTKTLILLHGWNTHGIKSWLQTLSFLEKESIKTIAIDMPGFGKSTEPKSVWSTDQYATFIKKVIDEVQPNSAVDIAGHSFGGSVATVLSVLYPSKINKLVLMSAAIIRNQPSTKQRIITKLSKLFGFIKKNPLLRKIWHKITRAQDYTKLSGIMKDIFQKVVREDKLYILKQLEKETLIIWGENDKMTPLSDGKIIQENIKNSKIIIFKNVNHGLHIYEPKNLAKTIKKFLYD